MRDTNTRRHGDGACGAIKRALSRGKHYQQRDHEDENKRFISLHVYYNSVILSQSKTINSVMYEYDPTRRGYTATPNNAVPRTILPRETRRETQGAVGTSKRYTENTQPNGQRKQAKCRRRGSRVCTPKQAVRPGASRLPLHFPRKQTHPKIAGTLKTGQNSYSATSQEWTEPTTRFNGARRNPSNGRNAPCIVVREPCPGHGGGTQALQIDGSINTTGKINTIHARKSLSFADLSTRHALSWIHPTDRRA